MIIYFTAKLKKAEEINDGIKRRLDRINKLLGEGNVNAIKKIDKYISERNLANTVDFETLKSVVFVDKTTGKEIEDQDVLIELVNKGIENVIKEDNVGVVFLDTSTVRINITYPDFLKNQEQLLEKIDTLMAQLAFVPIYLLMEVLESIICPLQPFQ